MMKAFIALVVLLAGCTSAPYCPRLPEMAEGQTLQQYTLEVVWRYQQCREGVAGSE
jgi:hypothetical protein